MKKRTLILVIVIIVLGVLAMVVPSAFWYARDGEQQDPGLQEEARKQSIEQGRQSQGTDPAR